LIKSVNMLLLGFSTTSSFCNLISFFFISGSFSV
jgi:hypothetical protein